MSGPVSFRRVLALILMAQPVAGLAQDKRCVQFDCRAVYFFRTCDRPVTGATALSGQVVHVSNECNSKIITMQIEDWQANNAPSAASIDLGSCTAFDGHVGDRIRVAVMHPTPTVSRYNLACRRY